MNAPKKDGRFPHRKVETISRDYVMERVVVEGETHYELTTTNIVGAVLGNRVIFNTKRDADAGLLDRVCTI